MAVVSSGTTIIDNGALDAAVTTGSLILLSTQTASSSASIEFTSGIDSTYDSYIFKFINIHSQNDGGAVKLQFNFSTDGGSNYNVTKTTTFFRAYHNEAGTDSGLVYSTALDLAQSTSYQDLATDFGNQNDECSSGYMQLFNPSSTTYVKHFIASTSINNYADYVSNDFIAGYANTTSAINAVKFQMSSGNIDDGIIKMYGVK